MFQVENFDVIAFSKKVEDVDIETILSQLIFMRDSYDKNSYADQSGIEAVQNMFHLIIDNCCRKR